MAPIFFDPEMSFDVAAAALHHSRRRVNDARWASANPSRMHRKSKGPPKGGPVNENER
jgi:hypothetical protein